MPKQDLIPFEWYLEKFPKQFKDLNTREDFFKEIEMQWRRGAVAWIKIGIYLDQAKRKLGGEGFKQLLEELGIDRTTAWRYRKLARNPWLAMPKNWDYLPANQAALMLIAKNEAELTPKVLDKLVEEEELHHATEPKEIREWLPKDESKRKRTDDIRLVNPSEVIRQLGGLPKHIGSSDKQELNRLIELAIKKWHGKVSERIA